MIDAQTGWPAGMHVQDHVTNGMSWKVCMPIATAGIQYKEQDYGPIMI